ncbi:MAG: nucleotidyl transferase AbiEii/AbiGii toxin family protein [Chloroflexota bacterium]
MFNPAYFKQVQLLLSVLPLIQRHECFALKGGTAMNLFVQDLPRLSVDIDLAFLPLIPRVRTLRKISRALELLSDEIQTALPDSLITQQLVTGVTGRLVVSTPAATIKIEPNFVFRGAVQPEETRMLCPDAQTQFEMFLECRTLSIPDLYGGKISAALDRQHPRDLFDVYLMFERFGLNDEIRTAFVVYLAGHPRPMAELLNPNDQPLDNLYATQFAGMTREPVTIDTLSATRKRLVHELQENLTENERLFLLSIKTGNPEWNRMPVDHLEHLPALQWKLRNIHNMEPEKHRASIDELKRVLGL